MVIEGSLAATQPRSHNSLHSRRIDYIASLLPSESSLSPPKKSEYFICCILTLSELPLSLDFDCIEKELPLVVSARPCLGYGYSNCIGSVTPIPDQQIQLHNLKELPNFFKERADQMNFRPHEHILTSLTQ